MESSSMRLLGIVLLYSTVLCTADQPQTTVRQGVLRGLYSTTVSGRRYSTFLGVPYAKPPVGQLRFKEPLEAEPWTGIYNATREPPKCVQFSHPLMHTPFAVLGSEDCLYLNVYTPQVSNGGVSEKPFNVIVFIHGGAFMFLSSSMFGGDTLLERDVILVTVNYRLGPLGFLSTGDSAVPGNNGLKDQSLALKWIQQNIAAFGGNPASVTIAGFSAGGASVHYHLLSPLSKGLFKRAICTSGSSLNPWTAAENAREKAFFVAEQLGCPIEDTSSMMDCLRDRPAEHIVDTTRLMLPWLYNPFSPYGLVVEPPGPNCFLPDSPINILKQGRATDVPLLVIFDKDEGLYPGAEFVSKPKYLSELNNRWDELLPFVLDYNYTAPCEKSKVEISQKIKNHYDIDLEKKEGVKNLIKMMSDRIFLHGIAKSVKLHASLYTSPVYLYRFSYSGKHTFSVGFGGTKELGVCHADDILYVLSIKTISSQETESDRSMTRDMVDLWLSFAENGTLSGPTVNRDLPNITFTDIRGPGQMVPTTVERFGEEQFWDSLNLLENIETQPVARGEL